MKRGFIDKQLRQIVPDMVARISNGLTWRDGCRNCVANVEGNCEACDEIVPVESIEGGWCILWERAPADVGSAYPNSERTK